MRHAATGLGSLYRRLLAGLVLLLAVGLSGCGFLFVNGPPATPSNSAYIPCTDSKVLPGLDAAMAGLQVLNIIYVSSMDDADFDDLFPDQEKGTIMALQGGLGVVWGLSARSGYSKVSDCRAARATAAAQDRARGARAADLAESWHPPMLLPDVPRTGGGSN